MELRPRIDEVEIKVTRHDGSIEYHNAKEVYFYVYENAKTKKEEEKETAQVAK